MLDFSRETAENPVVMKRLKNGHRDVVGNLSGVTSLVYCPKGVGQREKLLPDLFMRRSEVESMAVAIHQDKSHYSKVFYPIFFVLANFGLRISEAVYLSKEDFTELPSGFFRVKRGKKHRELKRFRGTKGAKKQARSIMDFVYVNRRERQVLQWIASGTKGNRIFPLSIRAAQKMFGYYLGLAGLRMIYTPHCLRRFVATEMDEIGIPKVAIKARLGHSLDTTELYQANPERMLRELEKWRPIE